MLFPPKNLADLVDFSDRQSVLENRKAFTLVELLTVIALLAILAVLVAPSIGPLLGAQGMTRAVNDVASVLELARTEAMARRTYVYVGFTNTTNGGSAELRVSAACSPDGSTATTNLIPVAKVVSLANVWQTDFAGLPSNVQSALTNSADRTGYVSQMTLPGVSFVNGRQTFSGPMIVISPQGELLPSQKSSVFLERANVGLVGMRGITPMVNEGGVVTFDGGSGVVNIVRP